MSPTPFTLLFVLFLLLETITHLWLASRQARHVTRHRARVPDEFAEKIGLQSHQRAADYTVERMKLSVTRRVFDAMVLIAFTLLGGLQMINGFLISIIPNDFWRQILLLGSALLISGALQLPFSLWKQFRLEQKFGFNRMTLGLFVSDTIKGLLVSVVLGLPLAAVTLWLMAASGPLWWLWAWMVWVAFNAFILFVFPTWIAPLFNKFTPLDNPELADRINNLALRCHFALKGLFVMDGSKRSAHGNAYFTGFGKSRRIVFFDTLLGKLNPEEIEAVLAHELGHFSHKHVQKRMIFSFLLALVFFAVLGFLKNQIWFYQGLGVSPVINGSNDAMALLLFFMAMPVFTFFFAPIFSFFSRKDEFEADHYAHTQASSEALISALVKLYNDNASTLTPDPVHSAFYDSHPPASLRIRRLQELQATNG